MKKKTAVVAANKGTKRRRLPKRLEWEQIAEVYFKNMDHLRGEGPIATVTMCGDPVYSLHKTIEDAQSAKTLVDGVG